MQTKSERARSAIRDVALHWINWAKISRSDAVLWCNFYQSKSHSSMKQWKQRNQTVATIYASHRTTNKFHFTNLSAFGISYQSHYCILPTKVKPQIKYKLRVAGRRAFYGHTYGTGGFTWTNVDLPRLHHTHNDAADGRCRRQIDVIVVKNFTRTKTRFKNDETLVSLFAATATGLFVDLKGLRWPCAKCNAMEFSWFSRKIFPDHLILEVFSVEVLQGNGRFISFVQFIGVAESIGRASKHQKQSNYLVKLSSASNWEPRIKIPMSNFPSRNTDTEAVATHAYTHVHLSANNHEY